MLRIHEIKLPVEGSMADLSRQIMNKLNISGLEVVSCQVVKESLDARDRQQIRRVYSVDFAISIKGMKEEAAEEKVLSTRKKVKVEKATERKYTMPLPGVGQMRRRPIIVGFGPCGMFAGLILSEIGYRPIILERGKPVEERMEDVRRFWQEGILDESSNVQFGEGGAGTFSDGKLTTQIKDYRIGKVLEELILAGGPAEIAWLQKPHIGTDLLRKVVIEIRKKIIRQGGEILFQQQLTGLRLMEEDGRQRLCGVEINGERVLETDHLILAIGHSARDTLRMLYTQGVEMEQKPFSMGVRIEHPQTMINASQFGEAYRDGKVLGAADYRLSHRLADGRGVYSFCMCPGGHVIGAASQREGVVTNGMSYHDRAGANANSALLVDVRTDDFPDETPISGIDLQEKYEQLAFQAGGRNYCAPAQRIKNFLSDRKGEDGREVDGVSAAEGSDTMAPTYLPGVTWTELSLCLPDFVTRSLKEALPVLGRKLKGFDWGEAIMTGVETRSSSPVRVTRGPDMQNQILGIYPGGEGAGYAGGIISAAVDGIRIAEEIVKEEKKG